MMNFGKSRAKMTEPDEKEKEDKKNNKKKITFDDVAGLSEEKEDLEEIVLSLIHILGIWDMCCSRSVLRCTGIAVLVHLKAL